jgi:hypothetical protein
MNQEDYNEIMAECAISEQKHEAEINRHNVRLTKVLLNVKGFVWVTKFLKDYHECECFDKIRFVNKPLGDVTKDHWGATNGVYVNQHCEMEDSYYGEIYFPVKSGKYLRCPFAC